MAAVTCTSGKRAYVTHEIAMRKAHHATSRQRHVILSVYRCPECKQWHMTSSKPKTTLRQETYQKRKAMDPWR
jgi:hypothetical protein